MILRQIFCAHLQGVCMKWNEVVACELSTLFHHQSSTGDYEALHARTELANQFRICRNCGT